MKLDTKVILGVFVPLTIAIPILIWFINPGYTDIILLPGKVNNTHNSFNFVYEKTVWPFQHCSFIFLFFVFFGCSVLASIALIYLWETYEVTLWQVGLGVVLAGVATSLISSPFGSAAVDWLQEQMSDTVIGDPLHGFLGIMDGCIFFMFFGNTMYTIWWSRNSYEKSLRVFGVWLSLFFFGAISLIEMKIDMMYFSGRKAVPIGFVYFMIIFTIILTLMRWRDRTIFGDKAIRCGGKTYSYWIWDSKRRCINCQWWTHCHCPGCEAKTRCLYCFREIKLKTNDIDKLYNYVIFFYYGLFGLSVTYILPSPLFVWIYTLFFPLILFILEERKNKNKIF